VPDDEVAPQPYNEDVLVTAGRMIRHYQQLAMELPKDPTQPTRIFGEAPGGAFIPKITKSPPRAPANVNVSQKQIIERLRIPSVEEKLWQNYGNYMRDIGPEAALRSEPLWGTSRRIAEESGQAEHEVFARLANEYFQRNSLNRYMSPDMAKRFMRRERGEVLQGIKPVE
jgi:hypothetical protein